MTFVPPNSSTIDNIVNKFHQAWQDNPVGVIAAISHHDGLRRNNQGHQCVQLRTEPTCLRQADQFQEIGTLVNPEIVQGLKAVAKDRSFMIGMAGMVIVGHIWRRRYNKLVQAILAAEPYLRKERNA